MARLAAAALAVYLASALSPTGVGAFAPSATNVGHAARHAGGACPPFLASCPAAAA
eukprot:CAMPEP_0197454272 /NCGR_PEP_ID=MMETSP1175-20131217/37433_1 /TAXON_ID=1003142 /ORGANISM="Triceratium dubium, Strain CCMP147" /LENGTH=55 /DNA_ID=CAMNT_0042987815 /DNA_START=18 /DNA_END=181 /DNA_ORIENTATION=+